MTETGAIDDGGYFFNISHVLSFDRFNLTQSSVPFLCLAIFTLVFSTVFN